MKKTGSQEGASASQLIDARIEELGDWRGELLGRLRGLVKEADPDVVEDTRRAIDFYEGEKFDEKALKTLVRAAVALNESRARPRQASRTEQ